VKKNNIKKIDLSKKLSEKKGFSILLSKKLINDLIDVLSMTIKNNNLNIKNLGTFKVRNKNKRIGRNPKTKENFTISSRKSISFIASNKILRMVNK
tara:strand:+ start:816 stop:1103 length:288 start_codon:yes stop_codon:yes gene_type:complete